MIIVDENAGVDFQLESWGQKVPSDGVCLILRENIQCCSSCKCFTLNKQEQQFLEREDWVCIGFIFLKWAVGDSTLLK